MISLKMDLIILNLMLMPHKFGANASNLVLMSKKRGDGGHYNFIFSYIMFYVILGERQENLWGEPLAFSIYIHFVFSLIFLKLAIYGLIYISFTYLFLSRRGCGIGMAIICCLHKLRLLLSH
jgi:hypothetical protein